MRRTEPGVECWSARAESRERPRATRHPLVVRASPRRPSPRGRAAGSGGRARRAWGDQAGVGEDAHEQPAALEREIDLSEVLAQQRLPALSEHQSAPRSTASRARARTSRSSARPPGRARRRPASTQQSRHALLQRAVAGARTTAGRASPAVAPRAGTPGSRARRSRPRRELQPHDDAPPAQALQLIGEDRLQSRQHEALKAQLPVEGDIARSSSWTASRSSPAPLVASALDHRARESLADAQPAQRRAAVSQLSQCPAHPSGAPVWTTSCTEPAVTPHQQATQSVTRGASLPAARRPAPRCASSTLTRGARRRPPRRYAGTPCMRRAPDATARCRRRDRVRPEDEHAASTESRDDCASRAAARGTEPDRTAATLHAGDAPQHARPPRHDPVRSEAGVAADEPTARATRDHPMDHKWSRAVQVDGDHVADAGVACVEGSNREDVTIADEWAHAHAADAGPQGCTTPVEGAPEARAARRWRAEARWSAP